MAANPLVELLLTPDPGRGIGPVSGALLTAYDPVTGRNTVTDGIVTWADLPLLGWGAFPTLSLGRVTLLRTDARPIIIGNLFVPEAI